MAAARAGEARRFVLTVENGWCPAQRPGAGPLPAAPTGLSGRGGDISGGGGSSEKRNAGEAMLEFAGPWDATCVSRGALTRRPNSADDLPAVRKRPYPPSTHATNPRLNGALSGRHQPTEKTPHGQRQPLPGSSSATRGDALRGQDGPRRTSNWRRDWGRGQLRLPAATPMRKLSRHERPRRAWPPARRRCRRCRQPGGVAARALGLGDRRRPRRRLWTLQRACTRGSARCPIARPRPATASTLHDVRHSTERFATRARATSARGKASCSRSAPLLGGKKVHPRWRGDPGMREGGLDSRFQGHPARPAC